MTFNINVICESCLHSDFIALFLRQYIFYLKIRATWSSYPSIWLSSVNIYACTILIKFFNSFGFVNNCFKLSNLKKVNLVQWWPKSRKNKLTYILHFDIALEKCLKIYRKILNKLFLQKWPLDTDQFLHSWKTFFVCLKKKAHINVQKQMTFPRVGR